MPTMAEEYIGNFGHLLLSAAAGTSYALVWRRDRSVLLNGFLFGLAFYAAAHAIVGPITGLTPWPWEAPPKFILLGFIINSFFGLCTAFFAYQFDRSARVLGAAASGVAEPVA